MLAVKRIAQVLHSVGNRIPVVECKVIYIWSGDVDRWVFYV